MLGREEETIRQKGTQHRGRWGRGIAGAGSLQRPRLRQWLPSVLHRLSLSGPHSIWPSFSDNTQRHILIARSWPPCDGQLYKCSTRNLCSQTRDEATSAAVRRLQALPGGERNFVLYRPAPTALFFCAAISHMTHRRSLDFLLPCFVCVVCVCLPGS